METSYAPRARGPRLKPLASGLALALALGMTTTSATATQLDARTRALNPSLAAVADRYQQVTPSADAPRWQPSAAALAKIHHPAAHKPPQLPDTTILVTNCDDAGNGSLRDVIDNVAVSGDTIDMTQLTCSTITMTSGPILASQTDLTLVGPGSSSLFISGGNSYSLRHTGTGTFSVYDVSVIDGRKYFDSSYNIDARGGCLYSAGFMSLSGVYLKYCNASTANTAYRGVGGAVYAAQGVSMSNSEIFLGNAGTSTLSGIGGGVYTRGNVALVDSSVALSSASVVGGVVAVDGLISKYSTIGDNYAPSLVGGVYVFGNAFIQNSTIAGNQSLGPVGGLFLEGGPATTPLSLENSTVSGNTASAFGGMLLIGYPAQIANSTIAFNVENTGSAMKYGGGLYAGADVTFESTIIAPNYLNYNSTLLSDDISGGTGVTLSGNNNLTTFVTGGLAMPGDTLYTNPLLQTLANNGGTTETHMLSLNSPAINAGNNEAGAAADQRGSGFPRVIGAAADIGAVEFNLDDIIFVDGFDP